ncbi:MAG: L-histidine N(alpha)-methyltransferase [Wenzhouxiangellaceae bacterium]
MQDNDNEAFRRDVVEGLSRSRPDIPCKYLYDEIGSELFEAICETEDYYVTRADLALHRAHLDEIVERVGEHAHIIELGSGAGIKIRLILGAARSPRAYTPIEISREALATSVEQLKREFPDLEILPLQYDYSDPIPDHVLDLQPPAKRRIVYFPGSTISNFTHSQARRFLERMRDMAGPGGGLLIGVDLVKPEAILTRAYDDSEGVTARFNLNLLARLQQDLGARVEPDAFRHQARFNPRFQRIEMHLVATRPTTIEIDGDSFDFRAGQSIHTENSHKYSVELFEDLAGRAGLKRVQTWLDPDQLFSMHYLEAANQSD